MPLDDVLAPYDVSNESDTDEFGRSWSGDADARDREGSSADGSARESDLDFLVLDPFWSTG